MRILFATLFVALAAPTSAQEPVILQVTACGPAAWRSRIGPTNLGTMLATQGAEAIWRGYVDAIDRVVRHAHGAEQTFVTERQRLLDYGGEVHLVVWLEQAEDALQLPRWSAALIVEPDGSTDLGAMAAACRAWLERVEVAAATRWLALKLSPPRLHGGRLVAVLATAQDLDTATARAQQFECQRLDEARVLRINVDPQAALGLLRDRASERDFVAALLGPATQSATLTIGHVGPRVAVDFALAFGKGDGGIVRGLLPVRPGVVDLDALVPEGTATHYAWAIDFAEVWRAGTAAVATARELEPQQLRKRLRGFYGSDFDKTVWPHLGREVMLLWLSAEAAEHDGVTPFANACLVAPVRDEQALIEAVSAVLKHRGERYRIDEEGVLSHRLLGGSLRIGLGVACVALGDRSDAHCESVLQRAAESKRVRKGSSERPVGAPDGWNGRGRIDVTTLFARDLYGQLRWLLFAFGGMRHLPSLHEVQSEGQRWLPLLQRHSLDAATTLGGSTAERWQLRILW